ncbi:MAG: hypothetical protein E6G56_05150 [Actinobacteria bacterium]|nr:MAG: hypothetical protein E6G56_05150 [Actinomycetota bacterium]
METHAGTGGQRAGAPVRRRAAPEPPPRKSWVKRVILAALIALASVNVWTGSPLLAVWIGSKVQRTSTSLSMGAVFSVIAALVIFEIALIAALGRLGAAYERAAGRAPRRPERASWMRSMRDERPTHSTERRGLGAMERIMVISVVLAVVAFEGWFFLLSGSSIGHG